MSDMVTIEVNHPDKLQRARFDIAARVMVERWGEDVVFQDITARRSAWTRYWSEVEALLDERADYTLVRDEVAALIGEDRMPINELRAIANEYRAA